MRVLHVVTVVDDRNSYGGPLAVALSQCRELRRRGHDLQVAAGWRGPTRQAGSPRGATVGSPGRPPVELEGVPARLFPAWLALPGLRFSGLVSLRMLWWVWRHGRSFDVVHVHLARDLVPLLVCAVLRLLRVPFVVQTHGMIIPDRRPVCRVLDAVLTVPTLRAARIRLVLTPQEDDAIAALAGPHLARERLENGIEVDEDAGPQERPVVPDVLFLARLHPRKRVLAFAAVARTLLDEGVKATFSIVGGDDGDLPALRTALAQRPDLSDRLRYEGSLPHEQALLRLSQASVYVLPSVDEPYPMTVLEAMARGVATVCTSSCGLAPQLSDLDVAEVTEADEESLASCVRRLLSDPVALAHRAAVGRKAAAEFFSIAAVVDQLERSYRKRSV